jgi:hypothetical protein
MHLDEETIQRLLGSDADPTLATSAEEHLASCAECRSRLDDARREEGWIFDQLRQLDHVPPEVSARGIIAGSRRKPGWARLAASVVLAAGIAGVAYAAPGSPLPRFVSRIVALISPPPGPPASPAGKASQPAPPAQAGIALDPGGHLIIAFVSYQSGDTAVVSLLDGDDAVVEASGGTTTFNSEANRLLIQHSGAPARFRISIPRSAPSVQLTVGGRSILVKQKGKLTADVLPDSLGRYVFPLHP